MSYKQKYDNWVNVCESIRPIWQNKNKQVRGDTGLWKIIHSISATPDAWEEFMDIVPVLEAQHGWLFKKNASKLFEDLHEIQNRIARNEPITKPGQQTYNLPVFRSIMSAKDILFDIVDNNRPIEWPTDINTNDVFKDSGVFDADTEAQLNILQGMRQMYNIQQNNPEVVEEIIRHIDARIEALKAGPVSLELIQQQLEQQDTSKDDPFVIHPTAVKHFYIDLDSVQETTVDNSEFVFAQICQQQPEVMELVSLADRVEVIDVVDTYDELMDVTALMAIVAFWFKPEDEVMLKLQGRINTK